MVEKMSNVAPVKKAVVPAQKPVVGQVEIGEKKSKLWLWIVIALVVIAVGIIAWLSI